MHYFASRSSKQKVPPHSLHPASRCSALSSREHHLLRFHRGLLLCRKFSPRCPVRMSSAEEREAEALHQPDDVVFIYHEVPNTTTDTEDTDGGMRSDSEAEAMSVSEQDSSDSPGTPVRRMATGLNTEAGRTRATRRDVG
jgi:hypothetical protein